MSILPVGFDRDHGQDSRRPELLALHELRRSVERLADPGIQAKPEALALRPISLLGDLLELVAAIDRRVPRAERAGEVAIARDAARLKAKALRRVAELERERTATDAP